MTEIDCTHRDLVEALNEVSLHTHFRVVHDLTDELVLLVLQLDEKPIDWKMNILTSKFFRNISNQFFPHESKWYI